MLIGIPVHGVNFQIHLDHYHHYFIIMHESTHILSLQHEKEIGWLGLRSGRLYTQENPGIQFKGG